MKKYTSIEEYMADLEPAQKEQVELLRSTIKKAHAGLTEHIKWNAPSYVLDGEDRVTFSTYNKDNAVKLILHMGATRKENKKGAPVLANDKGLVRWQSDIRGMLSFADAADIKTKQSDLADIIARWLAIK